jgi:hypothetical protein
MMALINLGVLLQMVRLPPHKARAPCTYIYFQPKAYNWLARARVRSSTMLAVELTNRVMTNLFKPVMFVILCCCKARLHAHIYLPYLI